jgi:peptidoglycan hydrolase-like protein with peptidoglycan-binding domain
MLAFRPFTNIKTSEEAMTYEVRAMQARCAALGFWPGPIDGVDGKRTQAAYSAAVSAQRDRGLPFQHASGLTRIHLHWTGGGHTANATDRKSYHVVIEGSGKEIICHPEAARLAHTLNANGGAIGISMACMAGAVERPFSWGSAPMTTAQIHGMAKAAARLALQYDIPITPYSVLTHAEVQPTLGITQRNKWDINVIPGMPQPGNPNAVGDRIRQIILGYAGQ